MKKKTIFGMLAILLVGLLTIGLVSAYRGDPKVQGPNYSEERHEAMEDAFESQDYNAWYDLMAENGRNTRVMNVVTEDNFATFAKAHEAAMNGDFETAKELRVELGLGLGFGQGSGARTMQGNRVGSGMKGSGHGQRLNQANFGDADNDGSCDNLGSRIGLGKERN